jgi:hypothetical protein
VSPRAARVPDLVGRALYRHVMRVAFADQLAELEREIVGEVEAAANPLATVAAAVRAPAQRRTATIAHDGHALKAARPASTSTWST